MKRMPEAEVSLRLALWLIGRGLAKKRVEVALDGAQIQTGSTQHFDPRRFLSSVGWSPDDSKNWRTVYRPPAGEAEIRVHSNPGRGDVVAALESGQTLRAECKKGPLSRSRSSQEYPLIREALGQLLTVAEVSDRDILAVAVPHSEKFAELAQRWRDAPLIKRFGIRIITVDVRGGVHGF